MFGSSHSSCFCDEEISIVAGKGGSLYENLTFSQNGTFSINNKSDNFNKNLFKNSLGNASNCTSDYDYFLINIALTLDLLDWIQPNTNNSPNEIKYISDQLFLDIVHTKFSEKNFIINQNFQKRLINAGVEKEQIFFISRPLLTLPKSIKMIPNDRSLSDKISNILTLLKNEVEKNLNRVILPSNNMLTNGFFTKPEFSKNAIFLGNFRNKNSERKEGAYLIHKNKYYARKIMEIFFELKEN